MTDPETQLRETILTLLEQRDPGKTICPSEAARRAFPQDWRAYMALTRRVAVNLAKTGSLEICQGGEAITPSSLHGPIRLRKAK